MTEHKTVLEIDGKKYILYSEYEKERKKKIPKETHYFEVLNREEMYSDATGVCALGSFKLGKEWVVSSISLDYLKKIVKSLDWLHESVDVVFTDKKPVIFGKINIKNGLASGFALAPRTTDGEY